MINVGIAGIGFMGWIHYLAYERSPLAKVGAICTRSEKKLAGDWSDIKGNFGPPGRQVDLSGISAYRDFSDLLADPKIDLIDICLPPAMHADAAVAALEAGKHVFCEKPISVSVADAQRMVDAAQRSGKQLTIGHVLPFFPEFKFVRQASAEGRYGRLRGGHFKRIIADPSRLWLKDFFDPVKVGGPLVDLHIHDAHFIRLLWGMPQAVFTTGRLRDNVPEFVTTQFLFDDREVSVSAASGVIPQTGRPFSHGFEIYFDQATLCFDFSVLGDQAVAAQPLTVIAEDGTVQQPELGSGDPVDSFVEEIGEVLSAINSGQPSELLAGDLARDALVLCDCQAESLRRREIVAAR